MSYEVWSAGDPPDSISKPEDETMSEHPTDPICARCRKPKSQHPIGWLPVVGNMLICPQSTFTSDPALEDVGLRAVAYMAESMDMRHTEDDQEQNFILGHLHTFAAQELERASSLAPVAPTATESEVIALRYRLAGTEQALERLRSLLDCYGFERAWTQPQTQARLQRMYRAWSKPGADVSLVPFTHEEWRGEAVLAPVAADHSAVRYVRDLADRLRQEPTECYKEASEALIAYADELEVAARDRVAPPSVPVCDCGEALTLCVSCAVGTCHRCGGAGVDTYVDPAAVNGFTERPCPACASSPLPPATEPEADYRESDAALLAMWRSVNGPLSRLTGPLIRFAAMVRASSPPESEAETPGRIISERLVANAAARRASSPPPPVSLGEKLRRLPFHGKDVPPTGPWIAVSDFMEALVPPSASGPSQEKENSK